MTTTTAIGYHSNLPATDPESLVTEQVPVPELRPHDLLVEVEAVSVNPVDVNWGSDGRSLPATRYRPDKPKSLRTFASLASFSMSG